MPSGESGYHAPAMAREVIDFLNPREGGVFIDFTIGGAGHARLICDQLGQNSTFIGVDRDPRALEIAEKELRGTKCSVVLTRSHFKDAARIVKEFSGKAFFLGALWDLGLSSDQIDRGEGFSFHDLDSRLDMRQDPDQDLTAAEVVNETSERDLADLIYRNADERLSRRIAASIVRLRPLGSVGDLVDAIRRSLPRGYRDRDDVLRRTLQAIRMEVNEELPQLARSLGGALEVMAPGGRMVVLSYHSGEDGLTKRFFRQAKLDQRVRILTPKPLRPQPDETRGNSRARSAHLRAAEICG